MSLHAMTDSAAPPLFDRALIRRHRHRATRAGGEAVDYLLAEGAESMADRLSLIMRPFPQVVELGARTDALKDRLIATGKIQRYLTLDLAPRAGLSAVADEEMLPLAPASVDLILSNLSLHSVNDLPGVLVQARRALKPDGLFLACLAGDTTLHLLRQAWLEAETHLRGGAGPRVAPMVAMADVAGLMQRAGFALPVIDKEVIEVTYPSALKLMVELKAMGEANPLSQRPRRPVTRALLTAVEAAYQRLAATDVAGEPRVLATFDILHVQGWAPADTQPKPLRPGTAGRDLGEALGGRSGGL